ncbi:MAG: arylsulfotransferase family protein, partial [Thermomicrobiales bacterium]
MSQKRSVLAFLRGVEWSFVAFILALCGLAYGVGVATMTLKIFPYQVIQHAKMAFDALGKMEDENLIPGMEKVDEKAKPGFTPKLIAPSAGKELLLITGGFGRDAKHCPKQGCLAWIVDRSGKVVYSWPLDLDGLFGDAKGFSGSTKIENFYPVGMRLQDDGTLIVTFHGRNMYPYAVGMARIGRKGEILWKSLDNSHHWFRTTSDGLIYAPVQVRRTLKYLPGTRMEIACTVPIYDDGIRIRRVSDGKVLRTFSVLNVIASSGYPGLLYGLRSDCDATHMNSVDVVTPEIAAKLPGTQAGDFLVSLREASAVAILDKDDGHIKKLVSGHTAAQHSARFMPDGTVVVFDNRGGSPETGGSRIARINLETGQTRTVFPNDYSKPLLPFYSSMASQVEVSPDGKRLMITSIDESRNFEIDAETGKPLWWLKRVHDIA